MLRHIVMWKFRENEQEKANAFLKGLSRLPALIPEIRKMEIGQSKDPDGEYDAVLIADFENEADLLTYKNHPEHRALSALCKEIRTDRRFIDYKFDS